ncbi:MAG: hypothetical protein WBM61_15165 [Woeseiaceae bacterium]
MVRRCWPTISWRHCSKSKQRLPNRRAGYGGPCPRIGRHRYFLKLYALDVQLPDLEEPTKQHLEESMKGQVLAEGMLLGAYRRGQ